jgi:hypothetical protein
VPRQTMLVVPHNGIPIDVKHVSQSPPCINGGKGGGEKEYQSCCASHYPPNRYPTDAAVRTFPVYQPFELTDLMLLKWRNDISQSVRCPVRNLVMKPLPRSRATQYREPPARYTRYPIDVRTRELIRQCSWTTSASIGQRRGLGKLAGPNTKCNTRRLLLIETFDDACSSNGFMTIAPPRGTRTQTSPWAFRTPVASAAVNRPNRCDPGTTRRAPLHSSQSSR